jgi:hypothetical protein
MEELAERAARQLGVPFTTIERLSDETNSKIVLRCGVDGAAGVIVKRDTREDVDARRRFANEWALPAFLDGLGLERPVTARFLAGDVGGGYVVLEDLGSMGSMVEPLTGDDPDAAEAALVGHAELIGRLHSATAGRADAYRQLCAEIEPAGDGEYCYGRDLARVVEQAERMLATFEVAPTAGFAAELGDAMARLADPGPFLTLVHADSCPENVPATAEGLRLVDFEHSGVGHALLDATMIEMAFPTCNHASRVPGDAIARAVAAYRRTFVSGDDRRLDEGYVDAFWGFRMSLIFDDPLAEERQWGFATVRQRMVHWAEHLGHVAASRGRLPAVAATATRLAGALRARWGADFVELPLYRPFR